MNLLGVALKRYLGYIIQALQGRTDILEEFHTEIMRVKFFQALPPDSFSVGCDKKKDLED